MLTISFSKLVPQGTTRKEGKNARIWIKGILGIHNSLLINFDTIEFLTPSFADECIGKLLIELGETVFRNNIKLIGGNNTVKTLISQVLCVNLSELK